LKRVKTQTTTHPFNQKKQQANSTQNHATIIGNQYFIDIFDITAETSSRGGFPFYSKTNPFI